MIYESNFLAICVFVSIVALTLGLSFYLGAKAKSSEGFFAAGGNIPWFVNGIAFAGDYLSAASFLGICGMIAFFGYDGFLYSIGYLAGWVVALLVIAEPLKRMGKYTFADALDSRFGSKGIKLVASLSTLLVSIFYLIPQMVGAGALVKPLLGLPYSVGVVMVGGIVTLIVCTAGMVSTTYVQFIKGGLLVVFSLILTVMILNRGLEVREPMSALESNPDNISDVMVVQSRDGARWIDGKPQGTQPGEHDLRSVGRVAELPKQYQSSKQTGPLGPLEYLRVLSQSKIEVWTETKSTVDGFATRTFAPKIAEGRELLQPGNHPTFKGIRGDRWIEKLDFISLMLALFGGTASLPHILIRYYTVKDQASARKSTIVGIAAIGFFYVLTLYIGLGAMVSGALDVTDPNMAAPLLAKSFGSWLFAAISAIAFTTVLGTVSGLIIASSGTIAHDLVGSVMGIELSGDKQVRIAKIASVAVGVIAILLGLLFEGMNVAFLVGWAFCIAASANLPSLVMLLFWKGTTKQGVIVGVLVGLFSSLGWILLCADTYAKVYGLPASDAWIQLSQPGLFTIPLGFLTVWITSLATSTSKTNKQTASA
ncbi:MAG: cation acetate symporter [Planctomycetota bacterium]|nr:cation acetate symporter [Planctomycetota bacterium]